VTDIFQLPRFIETFSTKPRLFLQKAATRPPQGAPLMKRILLSTSLALALSGTLAFAQSTTTTTPPPAGKHYRHHPKDPQQQAAWLSKKLNLSPDQTAKLEPILADRSQKMAALRSNTSISHEEWKQQVRTIHESTQQQLATVLTPEQL
jgi:Spy/CpxP family protein refolding chaperone